MTDGRERRTEERLEHKWPVMFSDDFAQNLYQGLMVDVSSGGMAFTCSPEAARLETGTEISVQFGLPRSSDPADGQINLMRTATIRRIDQISPSIYRIGVQFEKPLTLKPHQEIGAPAAQTV